MTKPVYFPVLLLLLCFLFSYTSAIGGKPVDFQEMIEELRMNQTNDFSIETLNKDDFFFTAPDNGSTGSSTNTLNSDAFDDIFEEMKEVKDISEATTINLPVGISSSGLNAKLLIVNAYFSVDYVMLDILAQVIIKGATFRFGCWNVKYYYEHGFQGEPKLALLSDVQIPITKDGTNLILKGDFNRNEGEIDFNKVCYIGFGCEGIQSLEGQFIGTLTIAEDKDGDGALIQPVIRKDNDFVAAGDEGLTIDFKTTCSLDNFYFSTSLGLFTIRGTDVIFDVKGLTVDLSNEQSHSSLDITDSDPIGKKVWQGFFIEKFMVYLPKSIERENGRVSLEAYNFRVDKDGISCKIGGENILDMSNGSAGGWPISVDSVNISITNSKPDFFRFKGDLKLPVMGEEESDTINYTAVFDIKSNIYSLYVNTNEGLEKNLGIFDAKLKLKACTLTLARTNNETLISADFSGSITLRGEKLEGVGLTFENFKVDNKGGISIRKIEQTEKTEELLAGFPIVIGDCGFEDGKLDIAVGVTLIDKGEGAIGGNASATIYCKREMIRGKERWRYDGFDLNKVEVKADFKKFSIDGYVEFYEDVEKKGFSGGIMLQLEIDPTSPVTLSTNVEFGSTSGNEGQDPFRYFYIDMFVRGINVPLFSGVNMTGIGGGVSYHMEREGTVRKPNQDKKLWLMVNTEIVLAGGSPSKPSEAALEIQFKADWTVEYVQLFGAVSLAPPDMSGLNDIMKGYNDLVASTNTVDKSLPEMLQLKNRMPAINLDPSASEVKVEMILKMDFGTSGNKDFVMTGAASAYVNLLNVIVGKAGDSSRAGTVYMVFRKEEWFVHAGYKHYNVDAKNFNLPNVKSENLNNKYEPLKLGLELPVKSKEKSLLSLQAYLLLGHKVPATLPHPKDNLGISGFPDTDVFNSMTKSGGTSSLTSGLGMAFGAAMQVNIPKFNYMLLYAKLDAYVGFDVLLRHYDQCLCSNLKEGKPFGINNWYAQGQAYAGVGADIGIRVKVFSFEKEVSALKAEMAMMLQAKLPNPTWFNGVLYGYYSVLGGAVSGDFSLAVTFGDECETINDPDPGEVPAISIVNKTEPQSDDPAAKWNPLNYPVVHFNYEFNKPFKMDVGDNQLNFKLVCEKIEGSYKNGDTQNTVTLSDWWGDSKKMFIHNTANEQGIKEPFKENTEYKINLTFALYMEKDGEWVIAESEGEQAKETREIKFTTTALPDKLSPSSIVEMYPAIDQDYFYKNQRNGGFIQIEPSMVFLLTEDDMREINIEFYDPGNKLVFSKKGNFNTGSNMLTYEIDKELIANSTQYNVKVLTKTGKNNNSNTWTKKEILNFKFKTSEYNTFEAKIDAINSIVSRPGSSPGQIIFSYEYNEPFGREEILGNPQMNGGKPLLQADINTNDDTSLDGRLLSLIYDPSFCNTTCFSEFSFDKTNKLNTICYNTNWDIMKSEMESESTFPLILTNFDIAMFGINQIKQNAKGWCLDNSTPPIDTDEPDEPDEPYLKIQSNIYDENYNMLYNIINDYKSDSGGDCSFDLPLNNRYEIPLKLKYYWGNSMGSDVKLIYSM